MQETPRTDSSKSLLGKFEEFWESEVPRVGEANAKGLWSSNVDEDAPAEPASSSLQQEDGNRSVFETFTMREMDRI